MADAVTSQTIVDGPKTAVLAFTNVSDGSGEAAVAKFDASALTVMSTGSASADLKITQVWWQTSGMEVDIYWNASANVIALTLPQNDTGHFDFRSFGGLQNNAGGGVNGDILFTTRNHSSGDTYSIVMEVSKA
tara:strand:+ start:182 stop:580 length:399 start_codon:yes stop_codon:yes gene_type:complete